MYKTLKNIFKAERHVSSAVVQLGVTTVVYRLFISFCDATPDTEISPEAEIDKLTAFDKETFIKEMEVTPDPDTFEKDDVPETELAFKTAINNARTVFLIYKLHDFSLHRAIRRWRFGRCHRMT